MPSDPDSIPYSLAHPVYLDVPMMVSFLAYIEGGLATSEEAVEKTSGTNLEKLRGRARFRLLFPGFGSGGAEIDAGSELGSSEDYELKVVRQHTAASLFNLLYQYLREDGQLKSVSSAEDLGSIAAGDLIELEGAYRGNPLEEFVALFASILPYLREQQEQERQEAARQASKPRPGVKPRKGQGVTPEQAQEILQSEIAKAIENAQSSQNEIGMKLVERMSADLDEVPVHDLLMETHGEVSAILTVSSSYFSRETNEILRSGRFRVVGKVTRVVGEGQEVNLNRRTVLGAAGKGMASEMMNAVGSSGLEMESADPIVTSPAVQVLPMAIFI